jgi:hypothetical protein
VNTLHFPNVTRLPIENLEFCSAANAEFRRRLFPHGEPGPRAPMPGQIDFGRVHAFALDRLSELLVLVLPIGTESPSPTGAWVWLGSHPDRPIIVAINLLTGAWDEPTTGHGGRDLVSLVAHLFALRPVEAACRLAAWLGVEARRHV